jgi:hypothetical protein
MHSSLGVRDSPFPLTDLSGIGTWLSGSIANKASITVAFVAARCYFLIAAKFIQTVLEGDAGAPVHIELRRRS